MRNFRYLFILLVAVFSINAAYSQTIKDSTWKSARKNIIRYNLSSALLFGFDKSMIFGYERVLSPRRSFSVNFGKAGLPKLITIVTDSFSVNKDVKNTGFNFSVDYRFYLRDINKYGAPRGIYIGPYYSFNKVNRTNDWNANSSSGSRVVSTEADMNINVVGFELGYQFIFWNRLAIDLVMIGPGLGWYKLEATAKGNLNLGEREQLLDAVQDIIQQKFPGMNYVLADQKLSATGTVKTTTIGYRYLIHVGFNF